MSEDDRRVQIVNEHMRAENAYDFAGAIGAFARPRYTVVTDGELWDGATGVHAFLSQNHKAFPDFVFEPTRVSPTTDAVLVEGRFRGTHLGTWRGLLPTGRKVDFPMCLIFEFEGEKMVNEKLYFDVATPLTQLGVDYSPNSTKGKIVLVMTHPITITKAALRAVRLRLTHRER